jgi:hypothetical protein
MEEDSNILVACHCKKHKKLFHLTDGRPLGPGADYVDPYECPDTSWEKIKANSKEYVYSIYCPVSTVLDWNESDYDDWKYSENVLFNILQQSYRVLKRGGKLIFLRNGSKSVIPKIQGLLDQNPPLGKWDISFFKDNDTLPFSVLGYEKRNAPYLVFTKIGMLPKRKRITNKSRKVRTANKAITKAASLSKATTL